MEVKFTMEGPKQTSCYRCAVRGIWCGVWT